MKNILYPAAWCSLFSLTHYNLYLLLSYSYSEVNRKYPGSLYYGKDEMRIRKI